MAPQCPHQLASSTASHVQSRLHRVSVGLLHGAASIQRIKVDFSKVPDWQRRAARLSIALVVFGIVGHCVHFPAAHQVFASNFRQSCNWAAITCIVVTAPLIGKVAQVAFDRLLGTAVGGCIGCVCFTVGFHMFGVLGGGVFISLMSGVTVWATTYLAYKYSLDQLVRFVQLTYIIVAFGAKPDKGALLLALMRVGGIFLGGVLSVVLAVLVLPRSASIDGLLEMKKALKALYDLNQEVWALSGVTGQGSARRLGRKPHRHGYSALQLRMDAAARVSPAGMASFAGGGRIDHSSADSLPAWPDGPRPTPYQTSAYHLGLLVQHDEERDSREAAAEKLFAAVYTALGRVDEHLAQTRGEIYIWHFWGRYFFLPGVHWFPVRGRWSVPKKDLEGLATCIRRVARMLWTLLLDFEDGFGSEMEAVLRLYYPKQLLSELAGYQARAILDLLQAFPGATSIEVDNLFTLGQVTDCLLQISDARARNTVFKAKRNRRAAAEAAAGASWGPKPVSGVSMAATVASGWGTPTRPSLTLRKSLEERRSLELSARAAAVDGAGNHAAAIATAPETLLERRPLLATNTFSPSLPPAAAAGAVPGSSGSGSGAATAAALAGMSSAGSGGGGYSAAGVFISRLMSGTPGEVVSMHLPPRRYIQQQQQQQRQGSPWTHAESAQASPLSERQRQNSPQAEAQSAQGTRDEAATTTSSQPAAVREAAGPAAASMGRSGSVDVFGGLSFAHLAGLLGAAVADASDGAATGAQAGEGLPLDPRSSLGPDGVAAPASLPLPPLPPLKWHPGGTGSGADTAAAARGRGATPFNSVTAPNWMEAFGGRESPAAAILGPMASGAAQNPTTSIPPTPPASSTAAATVLAATAMASVATTVTPAAAGRPPGPGRTALPTRASGGDGLRRNSADVAGASGASRLGPRGVDATESGLSSVLSTALVEPVTFPPTEEGYLSQVRWYSFQFVMDEMVNELEEAFHACSAVLQKLPYPIGN